MREEIAVVIVDPVFDFVSEEGIFFKKFGEDALPLIHILPTLQNILKFCLNQQNVKKILCTSLYVKDQFQTKGLEMLCAEGIGQRSCLDPTLFNLNVVKKSNSLYDFVNTRQEQELEQILSKCKKVLVTGMTTGSCVRVTVLELVKRGYNVVVARDAIAHRTSQNERVEKDITDWEKNGVEVVQSWKEIL
jgi:nicotinamidase-related amidase